MKYDVTYQWFRGLQAAILITGLATIVTGCSSSPEVWTDYDRSVNFAQYKTFEIMGHEGHGGVSKNYSSLVDQRIDAALRQQMSIKGFVGADNADLLINYTVTVANKQKVTTTTAPTGYVGYPYGYYRAGYYAPWPNYSTQTQVRDYQEGTLVIDIVDQKRKVMVWEGTGQGTVTQKKLDNLDETLNNAVTTILASFPPGAANSP